MSLDASKLKDINKSITGKRRQLSEPVGGRKGCWELTHRVLGRTMVWVYRGARHYVITFRLEGDTKV